MTSPHQVPCYLLLFLYPLFYPCLFPSEGQKPPSTPWFCKEWRVPLNRGIYTAFSYILFISLVIYRMTEPQQPIVYLVDAMLGIFITSYRYFLPFIFRINPIFFF